MKIYKTIAVLFLFAFTVSIFSCGSGSDKDKVIKVYKATIEFYKSDDFTKTFSEEGYMENKMNDILKEAGFENEKEFEDAMKQLENDEDIKKLVAEMETVAEERTNEEMEKLKEELEKTTEEIEDAEEELDEAKEEIEKVEEEVEEETGEIEEKEEK